MTPMFVTNIPPVGWLLIAVVVLVLFGRGKISSLMGEVGKGITSFKKGVQEGTEELEKAEAEAARDITPEDEKDKDKA
ncbi:MAG: twin-arginine translocase TatA/TatE family subunit [Pseudomonadota bacterium]